jgi:hypothetical protein
MRRIGMLTSLAADDPQMSARDAAFWQALQELGWTVGRNLSRDGGSPSQPARGHCCARARRLSLPSKARKGPRVIASR